jgi:hypothetical protein
MIDSFVHYNDLYLLLRFYRHWFPGTTHADKSQLEVNRHRVILQRRTAFSVAFHTNMGLKGGEENIAASKDKAFETYVVRQHACEVCSIYLPLSFREWLIHLESLKQV